MTSFSILHEWESAMHEPAEVAQTSAMLRIVLGRHVVTRNEDEWAQTVRDDVRLSAYPLALWFASCWWRLRWETLPSKAPSQSWRMAHELRAAGFGYVWPRMLFASDGENMHVWATQSASDAKTPVRYLENAHLEIKARSFEEAIDAFISGVLARLAAVKVRETTLRELWAEVVEERQDPTLTADRQLEALLGFDPDEAPESLLTTFKGLTSKAGASALKEIAPVCAVNEPAKTLEDILNATATATPRGRFVLKNDFKPKAATVQHSWEIGRELAHWARAALSLNGAAIPDVTLCELVGLSPNVAIEARASSTRLPLSMAIRGAKDRETKFVFRRRARLGRRFEIARFVCDDLIADKSDKWLPATDEKTSRQRIQRAFAAELLCPINSLKDFLSGDFSIGMLEDAAEHFGVSTRAVESQLVNHRVLPLDILSEYGDRFGFPYSIEVATPASE